MQTFFSFNNGMAFFVPMIVNPLIQPDQLTPVSYYVDDTHFMTFGPTLGLNYFAQVSEYQIGTDNSLLPVAEMSTERGVLVDSDAKSFQYDKVQTSQPYLTSVFRKSATSYHFRRSFNKIDETISYAGGLIGVLVGIFFIMHPYTEISFEISLANRLFCDKDGQPLRQSMNFLKYLAYGVYSVLNWLGYC